ncbi:myrcene synthase, chloroplastic [Morus notabilis]|nr:myrcene synthase, chloroplastic [Morus notabilis]
MLDQVLEPLALLEHIDFLERLGLSYHFEDEIKKILKGIYTNNHFGMDAWKGNLHATALAFRLLRQYQYWVPQEVFDIFMDETRNFKESLRNDILGMLSLYEASFLLLEGETILEETRDFTSKNLQEYVKNNKEENYLSILVGHALEVPLHWRVPRVEARWFIDLCRNNKKYMDPTSLELAILDFNIVQSTHQQELKDLYRWWRHSGLGQIMNFCRDRLVENVLWNVGMVFEPQYGYCRKISTKIFLLLTVVDDTYDSYGTLDELEKFTNAFQSWETNAMDALSDTMKLSFLAVYNTTNELAYDVLKEQGLHIIKYLKKLWADLSKCYLLEAKWYTSGHTPTFQEYLENGWVSIAAPIVLVIAYICVTNPLRQEAIMLLAMEGYPSIIREASIIGRLTNDLSTLPFELEKGNVPTSIQCYMNEFGASEDEARQHIKLIIDESWKQLNKDRDANSPFSRTFLDICTNLPRMTMWFYDGRDGFGVQYHCKTKDCASSLLLNSIPLGHEDQDI